MSVFKDHVHYVNIAQPEDRRTQDRDPGKNSGPGIHRGDGKERKFKYFTGLTVLVATTSMH